MRQNKVMWHEGLFLQPQHFQQQDRYVEGLIQHKLQALDHNTWGFSELSLDAELLSLGKIGIQSAKGIMPDGTFFQMPSIDALPQPFAVPEALNEVFLFLALPLKQQGVRYRVLNHSVEDTISGTQEQTEMAMGSLAFSIVTEHQDLSGYTCLPICRIKDSRSNHQVTLDKGFLTTWLDVQEAPALSNFVSEVHLLLNHRADMLASRLTDTEYGASAELLDITLLQLVNRYEMLFHYLIRKKPLHPERLFQYLIQLMGEMATYTSDARRPIEPTVYNHADLFATFQPLIQELRRSLSVVLEQNAIEIKLEKRPNGLWVGMVHDRNLFKTAHFVLSVFSDEPIDTIRTEMPYQLKIGPIEHIKELVTRGVSGVPARHLAVAPRQLPFRPTFSYFAMDESHPLWALMEESGMIALHVGRDIPGISLELWAIKG